MNYREGASLKAARCPGKRLLWPKIVAVEIAVRVSQNAFRRKTGQDVKMSESVVQDSFSDSVYTDKGILERTKL